MDQLYARFKMGRTGRDDQRYRSYSTSGHPDKALFDFNIQDLVESEEDPEGQAEALEDFFQATVRDMGRSRGWLFQDPRSRAKEIANVPVANHGTEERERATKEFQEVCEEAWRITRAEYETSRTQYATLV